MTTSLQRLQGGLIVSCQAPVTSPLHDPLVIQAMALAAEINGALGIRLDTPAHVQAVKLRVSVPIIGLWKVITSDSEVYITPGVAQVRELQAMGADIIATDCTLRPRPKGETLEQVIDAIHRVPGCLVLADVSTLAEGQRAVELGADAVATTLYGYTPATAHLKPPGWTLLEELIQQLTVPVLVEGGIQTPAEVQRALAMGAWAVVVGTALTGLDQRVRQFCPTGA